MTTKLVLVSRQFSQWLSFFGILQLLFATALAVCGFVTLGLFKNINSYGIWAGLPMMAPAILCVVLLGTRHRLTSVAIFITNLPVLAITAYHAYLVYEEIDFWKDYREQASATEAINNVLVRKCYNRGDHCVCRDAAEYLKKDYIVQYCDQFRTGEQLFWTMFIFSLAGLFFSLVTCLLSLMPVCCCLKTEDRVDHRNVTSNRRPYIAGNNEVNY